MKKDKKPRSKKRDLIELGIILAIFGVIYLTGSQAEVFGRVQQVVLKTGIMNASALDEEEFTIADYDLKLIDEDGNILNLEELKGKTIFMNFWATWCPPCVAEMPSINALFNKIEDKENIVFLMISEDRKMSTAQKWVKKKGFDFPIYKLASRLPDIYETGVVPSTFVISPKGKIVVRKIGIANYDSKRFKKMLIKLSEKSRS